MARRRSTCWQLVRVLGRYRYRCARCGRVAERPFDAEIEVDADELVTDADLGRRVDAETPARRRRPVGPCPDCGRWNPAEGADRRRWLDQWPCIFGPLALAALALVPFAAYSAEVYRAAAAAGLAAAALSLAAVALVPWWVPIAAPSGPGPHPDRVRRPAYLLLAAAAAALAAHPVLRAAGPPANERCRPMVPAPGDTVRVWVDSPIVSVDGAWGGEARAEFLNAAEFDPPLPPPAAATRTEAQADVIVTRSAHTTRAASVYADVTLPDRPDLAGRTVRLAIEVTVEYPREVGPDRFRYARHKLSATRDVLVASPGEAAADLWVGAAGPVAGAVLAAAAGFVLLRAGRRLQRGGPPPELSGGRSRAVRAGGRPRRGCRGGRRRSP